MIDAIIRGTLGEFVSAMLDFYVENGLYINGLILLYALILALAKHAYAKIETALKNEVSRQYGQEIYGRNETNFKKAIDRLEFDWDSLAKETIMPVISLENALFFRIKSTDLLKKHFTTEKIFKLIKNDKGNKEA